MKSNEATTLLIQNLNEQTGGNSFCYVDVSIMPYPERTMDINSKDRWAEFIVLHNNGEYSLRNVHIEIQKPYIASECLRNNIPIEPWIMTPLKSEYFVAKHSMNLIYQGFLSDSLLRKDEIVSDVHFWLGNGEQYTQVVKLAQAHGGWAEASKIIESSNPNYQYEFVHPFYPNNLLIGNI